MDFHKKGWLKQYLKLRNNYTLKMEYDRLMENDSNHEPETILYELLQPTGLLYGHPANIPIFYKSFLRALRTEKMPVADKTKIVLTESFLHSGLNSPRYKQITHKLDLADAILESAIFIGRFYKTVYPDTFNTQSPGLFRREKSGLELSESVINMRIEHEAIQASNFWEKFFNTSLLFLDLLYFGQWLIAFREEKQAQSMIESHKADRLLIFKTILAAAYSNKTLEKEEKQLIQNYVELAQFEEDTYQQTIELIEKGISLADIDYKSVRSKVMKKHLMELAILTVSADREINTQEEDFLEKLRIELKLDELTFHISLIGVESFIVEFWQHLQVQNEDNISKLGDHLLDKIAYMLNKQAKDLMAAVQKEDHVLKLLQKYQLENLSTEDRNKLKKGLFEIISNLPHFSAIALPKAYLTFPKLIKVFPEKLLANLQSS